MLESHFVCRMFAEDWKDELEKDGKLNKANWRALCLRDNQPEVGVKRLGQWGLWEQESGVFYLSFVMIRW